MSSGRSPQIVMCASSTPSSSSRSAIHGPFRSCTRPVRTSVPVTTMPARALTNYAYTTARSTAAGAAAGTCLARPHANARTAVRHQDDVFDLLPFTRGRRGATARPGAAPHAARPAARPSRTSRRGSGGCLRRTAATRWVPVWRRPFGRGRTGPGCGYCVGTAVHQPDSGCDHDARRNAIARQLDRLLHDPADVEDDRTDPQRLLRDRIEELVARGIACRAASAARTALSRIAGCRVSRSNAHDSPVAVVSWPATSSVISWSRSSRSVMGSPSSWPARTSIARASVRVARLGSARLSAISAYSSRSASSMLRRSARHGPSLCSFGLRDRERCPRCDVEQLRHHLAQRREPIRVRGADDGPQDHLEGDLRHLRSDRELGSHRPRRDVRRRDLGHHSGLPRDRVAVEGGQHLPPPLPMHVVVDHQHRTVAEQACQASSSPHPRDRRSGFPRTPS